MLSIIPLPYRIAAIGILIAAAVFFGWVKGVTHEQAEFDAYKQKEAVLAAQQEAHNAQIIRQHDQFAQTIGDDYAAAIATIKEKFNAKISAASHISCRMRHDQSGPGNVPSTSSASGSLDAPTPDNLAAALPQDCTTTTLQLIELQKWVRGVSSP